MRPTAYSLHLSVIDPPAAEPISLDEAKEYLRVDQDDEDTLIGLLITAARQHVENVTRRALVTQTLEVWLPCFERNMQLPRPPLQSVVSVKYVDTVGDVQDYTDYRVLVPTESVGSVEMPLFTMWPLTAPVGDAVRIRYVAGYPDPGSPTSGPGGVPEGILLAIKFVLADFYEHREARLDMETYDNPTVAALLAPYRNLYV